MGGRLLVAYSNLCTHVTTTREYLEAFSRYSDWDVGYLNVVHGAEPRFDLNEFDAILHSYCARLIFEDYVSPAYKEALKSFRGVRALAVQDEYDRTNLLHEAIRDFGFHIVLTCVPQESREYVYPSAMFPGTEFITVLTGYVPEDISAAPAHRVPLRDRRTVIGYRGRDIGSRYGQIGMDKLEIGRRMREICEARGIAHDIEWASDKRIYGDAWHQFIGSCRTVLGSESGSNVFDFDGSIEGRYCKLEREGMANCDSFRALIAERERQIEMGQISPRVFEAAAQRTPMILYKGRYSGAIRPGEHYVELAKDFSNVDEVLRQTEDLDALEAMATRAHDHLIKSGVFSYRGFVKKVEEAIERKHCALRTAPLRANPYPRRSESVTDFYPKADVMGEHPTTAPQGVVYYFHKHWTLEAGRYRQELDRERATHSEEVQRLHTFYEDVIRQRDTEIQRLNLAYAKGRLTAVVQYSGSALRASAKQFWGARMLYRGLSLLYRAARHPRKACRKAAALLLAPLRRA